MFELDIDWILINWKGCLTRKPITNKNYLGSGVAQLAERSIPILKDPGSNPVIENFYWTFIYC